MKYQDEQEGLRKGIYQKIIKAQNIKRTVLTCLSRIHLCTYTIFYHQNDLLFFRIYYLYFSVHIVYSKLILKILSLVKKLKLVLKLGRAH